MNTYDRQAFGYGITLAIMIMLTGVIPFLIKAGMDIISAFAIATFTLFWVGFFIMDYLQLKEVDEVLKGFKNDKKVR